MGVGIGRNYAVNFAREGKDPKSGQNMTSTMATNMVLVTVSEVSAENLAMTSTVGLLRRIPTMT